MIKRTRPTARPTTPRTARPVAGAALCDVRGGITYEKIEWTWNDGGKTASDDWEART